MIFIFWVVFFIICDEKWYKVWFEDNQIIFEKIEEKSDLSETQFNPNAVYKNSDLIYINYEFENPKTLRKSDGMDPKYLAKLEQEKEKKRLAQEKQEKRLEQKKREKIIENDKEEEKLKEEKSVKTEKVYTWPNIIKLNNEDSISSVFQWIENSNNKWATKQEVKQNTWATKQKVKQNTWATKQEVKQNTWATKQEVKQNTWVTKQEIKQNTWTEKTETIWNAIVNTTWTTSSEEIKKHEVYYHIDKYEHNKLALNLNKWVEIPKVKIEKYLWKENISLNLYNGKNTEPKVLYRNSNRIKIYSWFENPINLRNSAGIDENFLAKQENMTQTSETWLEGEDIISSTWQNENRVDDVQNVSYAKNISLISESKQIGTDVIEHNHIEKIEENNNSDSQEMYIYEWESYTENMEEIWNEIETWDEIEENLYKVDKFELNNHQINISKWKEVEQKLITIDKPMFSSHSININEWKLPEIILIKINKYQPNKHLLNLKKWKELEHDFIVENVDVAEHTENRLSDSFLESLLENEEINIDTLESENDEFLQRVFQQTKDRDVMNLIVETYLNEYQFIKAKKFIEDLPEDYRNELKPSLNLRVAFNSFSLSSKTITENLTSLVQDYSSKNEISEEDKNRYSSVIALVDRNYDRFFEIAAWFTSEKNKTFTSKLQWYKDQIAKQMWMPEYYFDTLVSLELFNQWLFQPAKVLALYSLQQNSNYILPHQVLAYANFLTNSRDTSAEYLKKLVDLDPNNSEKYRFLMWVASYWDEKYEQSVVMLSMIKDEKLRLDTQRYLINDYLKLNQKNKLISSRNKLLWSEKLVASDFYTYFYETFFHPYSNWEEFQLYAYDTELANKMLRVCSITLENEEKAVCTYWTIGRNIAMWQFDGLEQYLLDLVAEYPQWYLYQALWDYYIQQWDLEKAKVYLIKAISLTQNKSERSQIKKLLQDTM